METLALVRSLGALLTVLGCLAGALWCVRRFNLVLPGAAPAVHRRLAVVERLHIDPRRTITLLRRDDVEHLIMIAPEGHLVIESRIAGAVPAVRAVDRQAEGAPGIPLLARLGSDFSRLVERARQPIGRPDSPPAFRHRTAKARRRGDRHA